MKLDFRLTGTRTVAVWADDEHVGSLMKGFEAPWAFIGRLNYLGISPKMQADIQAGVADRIALLNITARLTS